MTKKSLNKSDMSESEYINLIKENMAQEVSRLEEKINDNKKNANDKIDTVEGKIDSRLDGVDEALRGNGRIGIFEQIRNMKGKFYIIFICLLLLFGFKFFGKTLNDIKNSVFKESTSIEKVEETNMEGKDLKKSAITIEKYPTTNSVD